MEDLLIDLCKLHDKIKDSDLRLAGLCNIKLPDDAKQQYYKMLNTFINELLYYIEKFKNEDHVRFGLRFGIVRGYIPSLFKKDLDNSYNQYDDLLDFVADTDFTVLSKAHMIIEYMYHLLTKRWYTQDFQIRINGMA